MKFVGLVVHANKLFALREDGWIYSLVMSPTQEVLVSRMDLTTEYPCGLATFKPTEGEFNQTAEYDSATAQTDALESEK